MVTQKFVKVLNEVVCYNGVLFSPPRNPIFMMLIKHILASPNWIVDTEYLIFCHYLYEVVSKFTPMGGLVPGKNMTISDIPDIIYWNEVKRPGSMCHGLDRYNLCSFIANEYQELIIKTRYNDYPW